MNLEELVRLVVSQVLQTLKEKEEEKKYQALVLFTGGKTKYQEAIREVRKLAEKGWDLTFACSLGAEAIYGEELRSAFPRVKFLTNPLQASPLAVQEKLDLILIPSLSQNSLVKIALGLGDTLPTLLIKMALLLGKPILAANNAADARYFCQQRELATPSPGFLQLMDDYLKKIKSFGISLVDVEDLSKTAEALVKKDSLSPVKEPEIKKKKLITGEEVTAAALKGENIVCPAKTVVTPLARELANQYGVKFLQS